MDKINTAAPVGNLGDGDRAEFEREMLRLDICDDEGLERCNGNYVDEPTQAAWGSWQARALLAARAAPGVPAPVARNLQPDQSNVVPPFAEPAAQHDAARAAWEYSFIHSSATERGDDEIGPCLTYDKAIAYGTGCIKQRAMLVGATADVPMLLAPHYRGYAKLGTGQYLLNHSEAGQEPEFIISVATDAEKAGRVVGDSRANPPDALLQPEAMAVRIAFASVAGLDAMEDQLRKMRVEHFAESIAPSAAAPTTDYDSLRRTIHELRTYSPAGDAYHGAHVHKAWANLIEAAIVNAPAAPIDRGSAFMQAAMDFAQAHINCDEVEDEYEADPTSGSEADTAEVDGMYNVTKKRLVEAYRALKGSSK